MEIDHQMEHLTLEHIAAVCEGAYVGDESFKQCVITGAVTDSRQVEKDFLFIPIRYLPRRNQRIFTHF